MKPHGLIAKIPKDAELNFDGSAKKIIKDLHGILDKVNSWYTNNKLKY